MPFREDVDALRERNAELERVHVRQSLELAIVRRQIAERTSLRARAAELEGERERFAKRWRDARRAGGLVVAIACTVVVLVLGLAHSAHEDATARAAELARSAAQIRERDAALDDARDALRETRCMPVVGPSVRARFGALVRARVTDSAPGGVIEPADTCVVTVAFDGADDPCAATVRCSTRAAVHPAVTCALDARGSPWRVRSASPETYPRLALDVGDATLVIEWTPYGPPTRGVVVSVTPFAMP